MVDGRSQSQRPSAFPTPVHSSNPLYPECLSPLSLPLPMTLAWVHGGRGGPQEPAPATTGPEPSTVSSRLSARTAPSSSRASRSLGTWSVTENLGSPTSHVADMEG